MLIRVEPAIPPCTNDAQKAMGMIAMSMVVTGYAAQFYVPRWAVALCASAIGLGTAVGGWRLIKTSKPEARVGSAWFYAWSLQFPSWHRFGHHKPFLLHGLPSSA